MDLGTVLGVLMGLAVVVAAIFVHGSLTDFVDLPGALVHLVETCHLYMRAGKFRDRADPVAGFVALDEHPIRAAHRVRFAHPWPFQEPGPRDTRSHVARAILADVEFRTRTTR